MLITLICVLLCTLVWRWFSGREKLKKFRLELVLIPLVVLITILLDINLILHLQGPQSESVPLSNLRGSGVRLDPSRIVVAVFENQTGDPKFDPVGRMAAD